MAGLLRDMLDEAGVPRSLITRIVYADRYLNSPLTARMAIETLAHLSGASSTNRVPMVVELRTLRASEREARWFHDDWARDTDRSGVMKLFATRHGIDLEVNVGAPPHGRSVELPTMTTWTPEKVEEFAAMVKAGTPLRLCGRLLNVGESSAIGKAFRLREAGDERFVLDRRSPLNRPRKKRKARATPPVPPQPTPPRPPAAAAKRAPMKIVWADPRQLDLAIDPCGKRTWDLEADECRWPIGAMDHCARTIRRGSPYCQCHHALAYRPASRRAAA